jgi:hypothetical protein
VTEIIEVTADVSLYPPPRASHSLHLL